MNAIWKRWFFAVPLMALFSSVAGADFSDSRLISHPRYPASGPFILELSGTWPTDCHPGEQLPVVRSFDGQTVEIEYEIIVVHVVCNETETEYRSFIDLSDELGGHATGDELTVHVEYQGAEFEQNVDLVCPGDDCTGDGTLPPWPESGQYTTAGRAAEGLLLDRQNDIAVVYPLVYDESGRAEWLFGAGRLLEDAFFGDLFRFVGGDCIECGSNGSAPVMAPAGHLSMVVDRPGTLQVKVNDRSFMEYGKLVFGHRHFRLDPAAPPLINLAGRWALKENHGTDPPLGDLTRFLPPAFDIFLDSVVPVENAAGQPVRVAYLVTDVTGMELGQLYCEGRTMPDAGTSGCEFIDPTDAAEPLLLFHQRGPDTVSIQYGRTVVAVGVPPGGTAVRLQ